MAKNQIVSAHGYSPMGAIVGNKKTRAKTGNTMLEGAGGNTLQDRGAIQYPAFWSMTPYDNNNFMLRWQTYTRLYYTSWEAKKIVEIPINDAFRIKPNLVGIEEEEKMALMNAMDKIGGWEKMRRCAIQERLLGGCALLLGVADNQDDPAKPIDKKSIDKGDLKFVNVVTINQISNPEYDMDPFSPGFDKPKYYFVNGIKTHVSRLIIFDGDPLFNYASQKIMQAYRVNPQGFGESVLASLWDSIIRCVGTQQAAYQLIQKASVTLVKSENLLNLEGTKKGDIAMQQLEDMARMLSIYRAAILKGKGVEIQETGSSFGSVPELLMSYIQILSAASDIPASRFIGQAPGGLNATGEGDLENYYNSIASYQESRLDPKYEKLFDILGPSVLGAERWAEVRKDFELEYESLWNLDGTEKASVDETTVRILTTLKEAGIVTPEFIVDEVNSKKIFSNPLNKDDIQDDMGVDYNNLDNPDEITDHTNKALGDLINGSDNPELKAKEGQEQVQTPEARQ